MSIKFLFTPISIKLLFDEQILNFIEYLRLNIVCDVIRSVKTIISHNGSVLKIISLASCRQLNLFQDTSAVTSAWDARPVNEPIS